jgi:hypothetical protein
MSLPVLRNAPLWRSKSSPINTCTSSARVPSAVQFWIAVRLDTKGIHISNIAKKRQI